jgi:hypothetical protein
MTRSTVWEPLRNFSTQVTEELSLDDGVETSRGFVIEGKLGHQPSPRRHPCPRKPVSAMSWVTEAWGLHAVLPALHAVDRRLKRLRGHDAPGKAER